MRKHGVETPLLPSGDSHPERSMSTMHWDAERVPPSPAAEPLPCGSRSSRLIRELLAEDEYQRLVTAPFCVMWAASPSYIRARKRMGYTHSSRKVDGIALTHFSPAIPVDDSTGTSTYPLLPTPCQRRQSPGTALGR
jgi:hypothetical protein